MNRNLFQVLDSNNQLIDYNLLDKEICKIWNIEYDDNKWAAPDIQCEDKDVNEYINWYNRFVGSFFGSKKGKMDLYTAFEKLIIDDSDVSMEKSENYRNEPIRVISLNKEYDLTFHFMLMKFYEVLFNYFLKEGYKIKIL